MLKEQQRNEADPDALNRQEMIKKLERMQEIAKTEAKLEGQKVWTPSLFGEMGVNFIIKLNILYPFFNFYQAHLFCYY